MPPRKPARGEDAATVLARVAPQVGRWVERSLAEHDPALSVAQYLALERLDHRDASATDLAEGAAVSRSAVSQLVSSLAAAGLVERVAGDDRRRQALELTTAGRSVLRSARRLLKRRLDPVLRRLPPPERDGLARSLTGLEELLLGTAPPRRPPPPRP